MSTSQIEAIGLIQKAEGVVKRVQIDIVDGVYAENKTILPDNLRNLETSLFLDFHLMVKEPINWVESCFRSGADRIIGQIEMMQDQIAFMSKVQGLGCKAGLGIDIETGIEQIDPTILTDLDVVLLMNYPAGFGGQRFDEKVLGKIKNLVKEKSKDVTPFKICSDGGITTENVTKLKEVDEVAIGRKIFEGDMEKNIKKLENALNDV